MIVIVYNISIELILEWLHSYSYYKYRYIAIMCFLCFIFSHYLLNPIISFVLFSLCTV